MCGIIFASEGLNIEEMEDKIKHRGIDGYERYAQDGFVFSHFLHSVVGGRIPQPFVGDGVFIGNTEIYNWNELKYKYHVEGRNDSEVLFNILERYVYRPSDLMKILPDLEGDYAVVYYKNGTVIAFRDPFGVNPLFYSLDPVVIASERKVFPNMRELHPRQVMVYKPKEKRLRFIYRDVFAEEREPYSWEKLFDAVDIRKTEKKAGVLFSGGVDSTYIALRLRESGVEPVLYTAYNSDKAEDYRIAEDFAEEYSFKFKPVEITDVEKHLPKITQTIESCDSVKVGVALPIYYSAMAAKGEVKVMYSGSGADDVFGGYNRFKGTSNLKNELKSSLRNIYERDLYRDNTILMKHNIELRVPYLDKRLVLSALDLPEDRLWNKLPIREIMREHYKLEEKYWNRPKKAAQYGSKSMQLLRKAAKKNGYKLNEYLYSIYGKKNMKVGVLYTGGKDSVYALYLMQLRNYDISCLITLKSVREDSYMFHTPKIDVVDEHAERMGIPLIKRLTHGEKESELLDLEQAMIDAIAEYEIEGIVTGALYSDYQRKRIENIADRLGLRVFSPLWHVDQEMHMRRLVNDGFKFVMTTVAAEGLDKSWIGKEIGHKEIDQLVELSKKYGVNVAGEGGEFETLVLDGPIFKK